MSAAPGTQPPISLPPADLVIDDSFKEKDGYNVGLSPVITINNLDRVVSMKLEINNEGLLTGFVNYNQSHNKNDRAKNKNKIGFIDNKKDKVKKDSPALYRIQTDSDAVLEFDRLDTDNSTSLYIELVDRDFSAGEPNVARKSASDQVAVYYDKSSSDSSNTVAIVVGVILAVLVVVLAIIAFRLKNKKST